MRRRKFMESMAVGAIATQAWANQSAFGKAPIRPASPQPGEDIFGYIERQAGKFNRDLYLKILGNANDFKEGDEIVGVAAQDETARSIARTLLANTKIADIDANPPILDDLLELVRKTTSANRPEWSNRTIGQLKSALLGLSEADIHSMKGSLSSDCIACVVKLMSNEELIAIGAKVFNSLPNSRIGAKGYLGARLQPNSPTDDIEDIRWQVFDGFSYAVGDVLLGTNPVSSDLESVASIERALQEILTTFGIVDAMPHCVLAHIDVQAAVEEKYPKSTELWFQSIAGNDAANKTFDIDIAKMVRHAKSRASGSYGLYFETGQGADFTNGHSHGFDMLIHESRKYGLARALTQALKETRVEHGLSSDVWVHVNDVAGFIGPEVFRSKEQLVRCCLEDIVMGKLHGLTIGLDVCSTLHMDVSLNDLDWCLEQVAPANPAYLMALPTKIDPMLGYLTTGFQDHVRLREKFGFRVNDRMWDFFKTLGVIDQNGKPTKQFGNPNWVYLQYRRKHGDARTDAEILLEGEKQLRQVRDRGVFVAEGYGKQPWQLNTKLEQEVKTIYSDAKKCIWREWDEAFVTKLPNVVRIRTRSIDRNDYILHPVSGEQLSDESRDRLLSIREKLRESFDCVIVVSEGLNALGAMDDGHLMPLVTGLQNGLTQKGLRVAPQLFIVQSGRVRAGYRMGELLYKGASGKRTIVHIIGERPGSGHHTLSVYLTTAEGSAWSVADQVDHNITKVVSGIATTALKPEVAATECVKYL
jgi:ethanolamine ammonia-lyase large subunit